MNSSEHFETGLKTVEAIGGTKGYEAVQAVLRDMPELGRYVVEFGFGGIYARSGLDLKQREIASISSLISQGDSADQLRFHFHAALHVGLTREEVVEVILHCLPHVGIPKVMNAMRVFQTIADGQE
ncbi:carboxymuconolactone decarboxylase family protein [Paenibacillus sp. CC-CFT747]|nr:carboxymuconolactone decarboxylase family protein [Paenibacillus sp. CC-CFT747]